MLIARVCRLAVCVVLLSRAVTAESLPLTYHIGQVEVQAQGIQDRIAVQTRAAAAMERVRAGGVVPRGRFDERGHWRGEVRIGEGVTAVEFAARIAQLRATKGVTTARGLLLTSAGEGEVSERLVVRLLPGQDPVALANVFGLRVIERVSYDLGLVIMEVPAASGPWAAIEVANRIEAAGKAVFASPLIARQQKRRAITDPLFAQQWHLDNTGQ
ncbi:MAG TPA: hypothetical protein VHX44_15105 [Planctomycetota bacterium]|nr:hypothetical protein [Planctomycetota bacterium]